MKAFVLGAVLALSTADAAEAVPLTWTLTDAVFDDGGTATGSFVWDADTQTFGDYHVFVSGGDEGTWPVFEYSSLIEGSLAGLASEAGVHVYQLIAPSNPMRNLYLTTASLLTDAGGTVSLDFSSIFAAGECYNCSPYRPFVSGSLVAEADPAAVPEPAAWALMLTGFGVIGGSVRRARARSLAIA